MRHTPRAVLMLSLGLLLTFLPLLVGASNVAAPTAAPTDSGVVATADDGVELVLFWGDGCPHCEAERAWLAEAREEYPWLVVTEHEVWYDEANRRLMVDAAEALGFEATGVPTTIIGEEYWIGFSDAIAAEMEEALLAAGARGATDPVAPTEPTPTTASDASTIDVPLVGEVRLEDSSLLVTTLAIGFVDGVNPCSLWVISVLLAIVVRTASRRRVLAIGATFLLVTTAMYAVYMAGIYSAMSVVGHLGAVQAVVAVVAGVFGVVSVKDYFAFKKGISFTIPDSSKPGVYRRMRSAAGHHDLAPALGATVVLAAGVSLLETPCTAGFPVLWTGILAANGVGTAEAALLFVVYMVPFLLDELLVFGIAVYTLRATRMQEHHGRLLKLVAGTTMLALAATVFWRPETMNDPFGALTVFGAALLVAALIHLVTTRLLRTAPLGASGGEPSDVTGSKPLVPHDRDGRL